jgi:succinate dehydrogenase / fumarate reductase cytochrome b subunit
MTTPQARRRAGTSTIVFKMSMAVTGLLFAGYVLAHMYGNLKVFAGQEAFDEYAHHLRTLGEPILPYSGFLWVFRVVLLGALLVHAGSALHLWSRARRARSERYVVKRAVAATLSSKMMRWGGVTLLLFVIWHLLQFTTRTITPGGDSDSPYQRVVNAFQPDVWWVTVIYLVALLALAMHLRHGVWSAGQTLGLTGSPAKRRQWNLLAYGVAVVVAGGFALVPLSILFGIVE